MIIERRNQRAHLKPLALVGVLTLLLVAVLLLFSGGQPAQAVGFTVNFFHDAVDGIPGDGECDTVPGPPVVCTLRAAIMEANALGGPDVITLPPGIYILDISADGNWKIDITQ